jgi:hypothetical protein
MQFTDDNPQTLAETGGLVGIAGAGAVFNLRYATLIAEIRP